MTMIKSKSGDATDRLDKRVGCATCSNYKTWFDYYEQRNDWASRNSGPCYIHEILVKDTYYCDRYTPTTK